MSHDITAHSRHQLAQLEAQTEQALRREHARIMALIQPHIDKVAQELEAAQSNEDENVTLLWLYQNHRLGQLQATVERHMNDYATFANTLIQQTQDQAQALGRQAVQKHQQRRRHGKR